MLCALFLLSAFARRYRAKRQEGRLRLPGQEVSEKLSPPSYGAIPHPQERDCRWDAMHDEDPAAEHAFSAAGHRSDTTPLRLFYV